MNVSITVKESDVYGLRECVNRTLSKACRFTDVWDKSEPIMTPVLQAIDMLEDATSKTAVKNAVWPLAKAVGKDVPSGRIEELLRSLSRYKQARAKNVRYNRYENVDNDAQTVVIAFLNMCTDSKPAE